MDRRLKLLITDGFLHQEIREEKKRRRDATRKPFPSKRSNLSNQTRQLRLVLSKDSLSYSLAHKKELCS